MYNGRNYRSIFAGVDINVQATEVSIIVEIIEVFLLVLTSMYRLQMYV